MKLKDLSDSLEAFAPLYLQESYDNSGLLIGDKHKSISKAIVSLDVTEDVLEEAISENAEVIIAHHPLIFRPLKKITGDNMVERIIQKAIKNDIAIYAIHTNLDNLFEGVNNILAKQLGLNNLKILQLKPETLKKLIVYIPTSHSDNLRNALFAAGAGTIGDYDSCSFQLEGKGSFKALEGSNPFVGEKNQIHFENETKIEMVFPAYLRTKIIQTLKDKHPYEEPAFDIFALENESDKTGAGMIGYLEKPMPEMDFLKLIKKKINVESVRYSPLIGKAVQKIALCGGSGSFLIEAAKAANVDAFITGDIKYHDFFDADNQLLIVDIGHYESEQFTKQLLVDYLNKKFPNFAVRNSVRNTNVVNYL
ncbi:MAG: Nif3-like dinuclear metal center hexameric protein [Bacteroidales bacterium]|jgi:dinuclear metal center YbgI/SA1388 family protein|nr:Nif3-like dinuclear metal center hexameric protein [Bacteroidales bacterium]